jgi:hypothetical protein
MRQTLFTRATLQRETKEVQQEIFLQAGTPS